MEQLGSKVDLQRMFKIVFADSLVVEYNWTGLLGKKEMRYLKIIWSVLYGN
jgi:hypothetical protein